MKIAFLEDDAAFAATIIEWLEQVGHSVSWFRSGRECVRALSEERYDLCLFDWMLPDMSGPDVMAGLKLKGKHGGTVAVESVPGTFTCFTLRLPLGLAAPH